MNKQQKLDRIALEISNCRECKKGKVGMAVPGEGSPESKILFVGEAPGKTEAQCGRPFVGRSGKLLRKYIAAQGLENCFITSPVKYLPLYVTPTKEDIAHGKIHFLKQVEILEPRVIVLMGGVACEAILGFRPSLKEAQGKTYPFGSSKCIATYHPAALRFGHHKAFVSALEHAGKLV